MVAERVRTESPRLADVMAAADRYWETSGLRLTFEYVLLGGVNDGNLLELLRLLATHPDVTELRGHSASRAGEAWGEVHPALAPLHDGAVLGVPAGRLALTTDSFVVSTPPCMIA